MSSSGARPCVALALLLGRATSLEAQQRLFPQVPSFELPEASPRVHGLVGRLLSARHGDSRFGNEGEAEVALGENVPVLALQQGHRPITLGFGSQVYARFSLSDSKSALISNDWVVGFNGTATVETWAFTLELYHESSHLGDEYEDHFNATRLDWTREVAVGWASYASGPWRLTGGLSYTLRDGLGLQRPVARSGWTIGRAPPADCWGVGCTLSWDSFSTRMRRPRGGSAPRPRPGSAWRRGPEGRRSGSR